MQSPVLHIKLQGKSAPSKRHQFMPILIALPLFVLIFAFQNFAYFDHNDSFQSIPVLAQDRPFLSIQEPNPLASNPQSYELNPPKRLFFNDSNALEFQWQPLPNSSRSGSKKIQFFIENVNNKSIYPIEVALNQSPMTLKFSDIKNQLNAIQRLDSESNVSLEPKEYRLKMLMFDSSQIQFIRIQRTLHL